MIKNIKKLKIAIIGLGYVGLPLAIAFAKKRKIIGFDISKNRIKQLKSKIDLNLEIKSNEFRNTNNILFTRSKKDLKSANCFIITVPTPIDNKNLPDLKNLKQSSKMIAKIMKKDSLVIYESTVYPGCIEEDCVPVIEKFSGLKFNKDFFCGYSPERINPGDKKHTLSNIKKITSGSNQETLNLVDQLYSEIIIAGTYKASSIKIAEAAKVIENTQRDLNIALMNELSIIFKRLDIDTKEVIEAASTKWNFFPFQPGLVGGHCIGVDPYYLTYKSIKSGYNPRIILAGRKINDNMDSYVSSQLKKKMRSKKIPIKNSKILIMGISFKENCSDIRNSGALKVINSLKKFTKNIDIYDPIVSKTKLKKFNNFVIKTKLPQIYYDAIILTVGHEEFKIMGVHNIIKLAKKKFVLYDLKSIFDKNQSDLRL